MAFQITSLTNVYSAYRLFRCRSKKTSKLCVTGLCAGNSPETGEFPAQMASNAENVSIWWRHHALQKLRMMCPFDQTSVRSDWTFTFKQYIPKCLQLANILLKPEQNADILQTAFKNWFSWQKVLYSNFNVVCSVRFDWTNSFIYWTSAEQTKKNHDEAIHWFIWYVPMGLNELKVFRHKHDEYIIYICLSHAQCWSSLLIG